MMEPKSPLKSKTILGNIAGAALIAFLQSQGVELSAEQVAGLFAVANVVLRFLTKLPVKFPVFRKAI